MLPYCWNDETPLSNHELRMDDDVYQQRQDPAVTVGCELETGELALIWTTTPWTLPSNLAIAVGPGRRLRRRSSTTGERYVLAEARLAAVRPGARRGRGRAGRRSGSRAPTCVGRRYTPPFDFFAEPTSEAPHASRCCPATTSPPTTAPASCTWRPRSARRTWSSCDAAGIAAVVPVDDGGAVHRRRSRTTQGMQVFDANRPIIDDLKARRGQLAVVPGTCCCATRPTTTPTRTAGAAGTR